MGKCKVGQARCCSPVHTQCAGRAGFPSHGAVPCGYGQGWAERSAGKHAVCGWLKAVVSLGCVLPFAVAGKHLGWLAVNLTGECVWVMMVLRWFNCASQTGQVMYPGDTVVWVSSVSPVHAVMRSETKQKKWARFQADRLFTKPLVMMIWGYNRVTATVDLRPCALISWSSKTGRKFCLALTVLFGDTKPLWQQKLTVHWIQSTKLESPRLFLPVFRVLSQDWELNPCKQRTCVPCMGNTQLLVVGIVLTFVCLISRLFSCKNRLF